MTQPDALARRRDLFLLAAKALLAVSAASWLAAILFYDVSADGSGGAATLLLPTRMGYALMLAGGEAIPIQRIWGGPATLFGLQCLAGTLGTMGLVLLVRMRLLGGSLSRTGLALACAGLLAGSVATGAIRAAFPLTVSARSLKQLVSFVAQRQPALLDALRKGERAPLGMGGHSEVQFTVVSGEGSTRALLDDGDQPLRDGFDTEALRFALAQHAANEGDLPALRRLLPIALPMPPADQPARNDFARRLFLLGEIAGTPPVPQADGDWVRTGNVAWHRALAWVHIARLIMQVTLLTGLIGLVVGLVLRGRHRRLEQHRETLATRAAPPTPARKVFGRAG